MLSQLHIPSMFFSQFLSLILQRLFSLHLCSVLHFLHFHLCFSPFNLTSVCQHYFNFCPSGISSSRYPLTHHLQKSPLGFWLQDQGPPPTGQLHNEALPCDCNLSRYFQISLNCSVKLIENYLHPNLEWKDFMCPLKICIHPCNL